MPIVPGVQTLSNIQDPYNARSTSGGEGLARLGQGISDYSKAYEETQQQEKNKQKNKDANSAIVESLGHRTEAEYVYKSDLEKAKSQDDVIKASEAFDRSVQGSDGVVSKKLIDPEVNQAWQDWSAKDSISRTERVKSNFDSRRKEIDVDSTKAQVDQSAVDYTKLQTPEGLKQFHKSVDSYVTATDMLPAAAILYKKNQEQQLNNEVYQNYLNKDDLAGAQKYLKENQKDFDQVTWGKFNGYIEKTIDHKSAVTAGKALALSAEYTIEGGSIAINESKVIDGVAKLPESQQDLAMNIAKEKINEGKQFRANASLNIYTAKYKAVSSGEQDPDNFTYAEVGVLGPDAYAALKASRKNFIEGKNIASQHELKSIQDAETASTSSFLHERLDALSPEDAKSAPALLNLWLEEKTKKGLPTAALISKPDLDALISHSKGRSIGESTATVDDIVKSVAEITNKPSRLTTDKKDITDNPELLSFVYGKTKGVNKENLPKAIDDSVRIWYTKTRDKRTLGDVISSHNDIELKRVELAWSKPQVNAAIEQMGLTKKLENQTDETKSRIVTQRYLQNNGVTPSYRVDSQGKPVPLTGDDLFLGAEAIALPEVREVVDDSVYGTFE